MDIRYMPVHRHILALTKASSHTKQSQVEGRQMLQMEGALLAYLSSDPQPRRLLQL